jgi:hypothetical protein
MTNDKKEGIDRMMMTVMIDIDDDNVDETISKGSEYFRTLFTTNLYSPEKTEFFPHGVSTKNIMTQILRYVCRGH